MSGGVARFIPFPKESAFGMTIKMILKGEGYRNPCKPKQNNVILAFETCKIGFFFEEIIY